MFQTVQTVLIDLWKYMKSRFLTHKILNLIIQFMSTKRGSFSSYPVFINNKFVENAARKILILLYFVSYI